MHGQRTHDDILRSGAPLGEATHALLCLHGRGGSAIDILGAAERLRPPSGFHVLAPQATGSTWYPLPFTAPRERNEPWLSSALRWLDELIEPLVVGGIPEGNIVLLGFSQGACLASEFVASTPRGLGGLIAWSGGVIGEQVDPARYLDPGRSPRLQDAPVFLGCSDIDPHIPLSRVEETARLFQQLGARVDCRIYPGMGHLVNEEEFRIASELLHTITASPPSPPPAWT